MRCYCLKPDGAQVGDYAKVWGLVEVGIMRGMPLSVVFTLGSTIIRDDGVCSHLGNGAFFII